MNEQPTTATSESDEQRGLDRRKFLLGTTAVTAGAWAAPSIFTIDRAFGEHTAAGTPCPCPDDGTRARSIVATGTVAGAPVNQVQCPDEGIGPVQVGSAGTVEVANAECAGCEANIELTTVRLTIDGQPVTADLLTAHVRCCPTGPQGGSSVVNFRAGPIGPITTTQTQTIPFGPLGSITFNERSGSEFTAVHIIVPEGGQITDLKLATARCEPTPTPTP